MEGFLNAAFDGMDINENLSVGLLYGSGSWTEADEHINVYAANKDAADTPKEAPTIEVETHKEGAPAIEVEIPQKEAADAEQEQKQQLMCVKYEVGPSAPAAEYTPEDISENKVLAMLPYLMGLLGVIVALLAANNSKYVGFHVRQALKLSVCGILLAILAVPFVIFGRLPYLGIIFNLVAILILAAEVVLLVIRVISFFQVCYGKAKEPAVVGDFGMFK